MECILDLFCGSYALRTISNKTKDYRFGSNLSKVVDKLLIFNFEIQNIQLMEKQKK